MAVAGEAELIHILMVSLYCWQGWEKRVENVMKSAVVSECPDEVWEAAAAVGFLDLYMVLPEKAPK